MHCDNDEYTVLAARESKVWQILSCHYCCCRGKQRPCSWSGGVSEGYLPNANPDEVDMAGMSLSDAQKAQALAMNLKARAKAFVRT